MKKRIVYLLIFLLSVVVIFPQVSYSKEKKKGLSTKELIKRLPKKYRDWLDLVYYIITPIEKKVFLQLTNNRDRDAFIKLFWQYRDPTPGTPENEFKEEHIRRFKYANKHFKTTRPGWMTDMGKIYILLGPPNVHNNYDNKYGLYPLKIWGYYGDKKLGLPAYFRIIFYKRNGIGEYVLYDPAFDGPASLLRDQEGVDITDINSIYRKLKEVAPSIAKSVLSLIPGEESFFSLPTTRSSVLLSQIFDLPKKRVKVSYARHFLDFKGIVKVDYTMNYIENDFFYTLSFDPQTKLNFLHFSIKPHRISLDYSTEKDKYYFALKLDVSLKKGKQIVYHYSKNYSFYFTEEEVNTKLKPLGLSVDDMFPVIPGQFQLIVLLQNSVKKEFTYVKKDVKIPPSANMPRLLTPIPTYRVEKSVLDIVYRPFKFKNYLLNIEPKKIFSLADNILIFIGAENVKNIKKGKIELIIKNRPGYPDFSRNFVFQIPAGQNYFFKYISINDGKIPSAVFDVTARLYSSNVPIDTKENNFTVSPVRSVAHPMEAFKVLDKKNKGLNYYRIANEYENLGKLSDAEKFYKLGFSEKRDFAEGVVRYAKLLLKLNKYDEAMPVIETLKNNKKFDFEYFSLKGELLFYKNNTEEALKNLLKANKIYDSDYHVINLLGLSFLRLNEFDQALKAFKASISLNDDQPEIKNLIEKIKRIQKKLKRTQKNKISK